VASRRPDPPLDSVLVVASDELPRRYIHGTSARIADQCLALADREGRNVARATATEGARSVPLGALAHLLPGSATIGLAARVRAGRRAADWQAALRRSACPPDGGDDTPEQAA
jgi:hypothetical protein